MKANASGVSNERLRAARQQQGWSQRQLAELLGTNSFTITRWEQGRAFPSPFYVQKLITVFGQSAQALGLLPGQEPPATSRSFWQVPYPRNPHFTGREELLAQIEQQFSPAGANGSLTTRRIALTQPQAITGLGGIGKTQIAVEYAYRAFEQRRYTHVLWLNAGSAEALLNSFLTLAEQLPVEVPREEPDQHKVVAATIRWVEQCQEPWLLICDNADEVTLLQPYLPGRGNGSLLLTTRSHAVGALATPIEVENMGLVEGTMFLLQRAQRQQASEDERDAATNVVIALDGFPLALDQAGAYIEETGCRFEEYLSLYQKHRQALLALRGSQATLYPDSVATTWSLSFEKLAKSNPATTELLQLCTFLAPDTIPEELLTQGAVFWPPALQLAVSDHLSFDHLLRELLRFSLVKRQAENRMLSIHRLVQVVQRDRMTQAAQSQWADRMVRAVHAIFPADPTEDVTSWPQCLLLLEQAQLCHAFIQQYRLYLPETAELLERTGTYLSQHALYALAEPLFQQASRIWDHLYNAEHVKGARSLIGLADIYAHQGKYEQAEPLFRRALALQERVLGPQHPEVARPLNMLAELYLVQGKYEQAELLLQQTLSLQEHVLGPDHPKVARSLDVLASLYNNQGKYEQAEPLFQRALAILERALGPEHPQVARSLNGLAILYSKQGRYEQAEPLFHRAIAIREKALGPAHPEVAFSLNGLANLLSATGRNQQAESLFQRALALREQAIGEEHIDTAETLHDFAVSQESQNRYQEAASLYQRAMIIRDKILGAEHPQAVATRARLQVVLRTMESSAEVTRNTEALPGLAERKQVEYNAEVGRAHPRGLPVCPHCQSTSAVEKSGINRSGSQRFHCQRCQRYFTPQATARGYEQTWKDQAILLAKQGKSYRFIARQMGINHRTIHAWIQASKGDGNSSGAMT